MKFVRKGWKTLRQHIADPAAGADRYRASVEAQRQSTVVPKGGRSTEDCAQPPAWPVPSRNFREKLDNPVFLLIAASLGVIVLGIIWPHNTNAPWYKQIIPIVILFYLMTYCHFWMTLIISKIVKSNSDIFLIKLFIYITLMILVFACEQSIFGRSMIMILTFSIADAIRDFRRSLNLPTK